MHLSMSDLCRIDGRLQSDNEREGNSIAMCWLFCASICVLSTIFLNHPPSMPLTLARCRESCEATCTIRVQLCCQRCENRLAEIWQASQRIACSAWDLARRSSQTCAECRLTDWYVWYGLTWSGLVLYGRVGDVFTPTPYAQSPY